MKIKVNYIKNISLLLILTASWTILSCEDFVDINPPITEVISETVYTNDETATSAVRGIYVQMITGGFASGGSNSITILGGLSSDDLLDVIRSNDRMEFNANNLNSSNSTVFSLWSEAYNVIYNVNSLIAGLNNSNDVSETVKNQLLGEAMFIRAFVNFYLVNLYGDVPLITSTDFRVNTAVFRSPKFDVYQHIIEDLKKAQGLLSEDYSFSKDERVQPNQFAASALLSRVYLYMEDWVNAENQATSVIDNSGLYKLEDDLDNVFLDNSTEAIWQLKPVFPGNNTNEARIFINPPDAAPTNHTLTNQLVSAFEEGDQRRSSWVDSIIFDGVTYYHPFKYKVFLPNQPLTEYSMLFRLGELYLIRAEARANQNRLGDAITDIDAIRKRAGLPLIQDTNPSINQTDLLVAIEQERRVELFTEWGHRWLDLKRTNRTNAVLSPISLKDWQPTDVLYPIPQSEREANINLTQNDGYQ